MADGTDSVRLSRKVLVKTKGVDIVHTFCLVPSQTALGVTRIPHVFVGSHCYQGLECSSSPTSGTRYPLVRGFFALMC